MTRSGHLDFFPLPPNTVSVHSIDVLISSLLWIFAFIRFFLLLCLCFFLPNKLFFLFCDFLQSCFVSYSSLLVRIARFSCFLVLVPSGFFFLCFKVSPTFCLIFSPHDPFEVHFPASSVRFFSQFFPRWR